MHGTAPDRTGSKRTCAELNRMRTEAPLANQFQPVPANRTKLNRTVGSLHMLSNVSSLKLDEDFAVADTPRSYK